RRNPDGEAGGGQPARERGRRPAHAAAAGRGWDMTTDRLPPHNPDAERGLICGILRDPDTLPAVQQVVRAEDFYQDAHQRVFRAIADLADQNRPVDLVLLSERLRHA